MSESYTSSSSLKSNYSSIESFVDVLDNYDDLENEVFGEIDSMCFSPSQDTMMKIYSFL